MKIWHLPITLHAPFANIALKAGVHVIVEKPMAMTAAEAQTMIDASETSGAKLMVAHCWRFDEEVLWLKEQVDSGNERCRSAGNGISSRAIGSIVDGGSLFSL